MKLHVISLAAILTVFAFAANARLPIDLIKGEESECSLCNLDHIFMKICDFEFLCRHECLPSNTDETDQVSAIQCASTPLDQQDFSETYDNILTIRDQRNYSVCYAIVAADMMTYAAMQTFSDYNLTLSPQQFIDCTKGPGGNHGLKGGSVANAFTYAYNTLIKNTVNYNFDLADSDCRHMDEAGAFKTTGLKMNIPSTELDYRKCLSIAPIVVGIYSTQELKDYRGGVIQYPCPENATLKTLNHYIILTGFLTYEDVPVFKFRNSWGTGWGVNGYGFVKRDDVTNPLCILMEGRMITVNGTTNKAKI